MMRSILLVAVLAFACIVATNASVHHSTHTRPAAAHVLYERSTVPLGWTKAATAPLDAKVEFTIALKQRNLDILDKWFTESSNPQHANYQEFKDIKTISDLVSPKKSDKARVMSWLQHAGVRMNKVKDFGDALDVETNVKVATGLFNTQFHLFTHSETGAMIVRQFGAYSVPLELKNLVEMVTGVSTFPIPHLRVQRGLNASNDYGVVPQTVDSLYSISQAHRKMYSKAKGVYATVPSQSVIEFQGQNFAPSDLLAFGTGVGENVQVLPASQIVGPNDITNPQVEATLDIQMTAGVNLEANNWFWLEAGNGWLYQFGIHFFSTPSVPMVNSISYGWWEGDQCTIDQTECSALGVDSTGYVTRVNTEFQKIAVRGISLISASGDSGANGRTDPDCSDAHLRAPYPASSPYITAVGATELTNTAALTNPPAICASAGLSCVSGGSEQAVSYAISGFASGGGFSDIAPQPSYQAAAVKAYLNSGVALPPTAYYNASGRGFPDIAAVGHNLLIVDSGSAQPVGGTSASSPIIAAIMSLLNNAQIEATGKPLGFLNPFLYQMYAAEPSAFQDITIGDNKCTEQGCSASCQGYECAKGWDPVSGLGSPNVAVMLEYVKSKRAMRK